MAKNLFEANETEYSFVAYPIRIKVAKVHKASDYAIAKVQFRLLAVGLVPYDFG
jgi:hypothetical protein